MVNIITPKIKNKELPKIEPEVVIDNNEKAITEVKAIIAANGIIYRNELNSITEKYPKAINFNTKRITETAEIGIRNTENFLLLKKNFLSQNFSILANENAMVW